MSKVAVIIPAAGQSTRFKLGQRKKVFTELKGRAVWLRSAEHFVNRPDVVQTIVAISPADEEFFKEKFRPNLAFMAIDLVHGGASRAETVKNALAVVKDEADFIAVHDAARPLLTAKWIDQVFNAAFEVGAAIPAVPVASTLKRVTDDQQISETVDRSGLWGAQTPQVFRRDILEGVYENHQNLNATDESQMVQDAGHPVKVVEGASMNFKITTTSDFKMAEALIDRLPKEKPNLLHPFADEL
ncbi:MAG: 2-C-methyl-D-erythritol 4-phosphate cytidylyltransferase [Planctomycetaceae bacterium]